jgi:hypothetical protein
MVELSTEDEHAKNVNKILSGFVSKREVVGVGLFEFDIAIADLLEQWMLGQNVMVTGPYLQQGVNDLVKLCADVNALSGFLCFSLGLL